MDDSVTVKEHNHHHQSSALSGGGAAVSGGGSRSGARSDPFEKPLGAHLKMYALRSPLRSRTAPLICSDTIQ